MTIFQKYLILASAPLPKSTPGDSTQAFKLKSCLICLISIAPLPACKISAKNIDNCLKLLQNLNIRPVTPDPLGQRVEVKSDAAMLIYRHWAIMVYSEKLLNITALRKCDDHPPYSPDMAPSDFYLFPKLKSHLRGTQYESNEGIIGSVNE